jgi:hypothetical protein
LCSTRRAIIAISLSDGHACAAMMSQEGLTHVAPPAAHLELGAHLLRVAPLRGSSGESGLWRLPKECVLSALY